MTMIEFTAREVAEIIFALEARKDDAEGSNIHNCNIDAISSALQKFDKVSIIAYTRKER